MFFYLSDGTIQTRGQGLKAGDGYAAAAGSSHTDFSTDSGAVRSARAGPDSRTRS